VQNATNWISNYLHGGVTCMVSAGELHLPGLPIDKPDPNLFRSLALLTRAC
jgi:enamidase